MRVPKPETIKKFVQAGEDAGLTVDQMIDLLRRGLSVDTLMDMIEWRLSKPIEAPRSSRWIM